MSIIPAPLQVTPAEGTFRFGGEATVACAAGDLAPVVARFCADFERRTGIRTKMVPAGAGDITISLGEDPDLGVLPAPYGIDPEDTPADESYALTITGAGITLVAAEAIGIAHGLTSLLQLAATTATATTATTAGRGRVELRAQRILDAPRFTWRELSLDVARRYFTPAEIRRVIDLAALYKLNVLHLHLTDDVAWRIEAGRPAAARQPDGTFYTNDELRALAGYAAGRFVTLVPEVDTPGHAAALVRMHPELRTERNVVSYELEPGVRRQTCWLDPDAPATFDVMGAIIAELAQVFPCPFIHIGADEAWSMPADAYGAYLGRLRELVLGAGRQMTGWQEAIRGGVPIQAIQYWMSPATFEPGVLALSPQAAAMVTANASQSRADLAKALELGVPVLMSPASNCYLDVPYGEGSADGAQDELRKQVGLQHYPATTLEATFGWEPVAALGPVARPRNIAGVGAVVWCETVRDFSDLTFLLLPRLAGIAEQAWGAASKVSWAEHREALARHGRLWEQDGLVFFRGESVGWA
jgi:hexosaminidase